jgi:hypothetical protein
MDLNVGIRRIYERSVPAVRSLELTGIRSLTTDLGIRVFQVLGNFFFRWQTPRRHIRCEGECTIRLIAILSGRHDGSTNNTWLEVQ